MKSRQGMDDDQEYGLAKYERPVTIIQGKYEQKRKDGLVPSFSIISYYSGVFDDTVNMSHNSEGTSED